MPRYRVGNRVTREVYEVEAPYAQDACERLGWIDRRLLGKMYQRRASYAPYPEAHKG